MPPTTLTLNLSTPVPTVAPASTQTAPVRSKRPTTSVALASTPPKKRKNLGVVLGQTSNYYAAGTKEITPAQDEVAPNRTVTQVDKKGRAKVGILFPPTKIHLSLFSCPEALRKYPSFRWKVCQPQRGFPSETLQTHPRFSEMIQSLGWELFYATPEQYNIDWVTDFFTELSITSGLNVMIRETPVSFSADRINTLLGLSPPAHSEFHRLLDEASDDDLSTFLHTIARNGAKWSFTGRTRVLKASYLKPVANVWFHFIRHSLHPSTHDSNLCMERVFLLYCVLVGAQIDVGRVISMIIRRGCERSNARLIFPSIIHGLLTQAGVPKLPTDRLSLEKVVLDSSSVSRLMRKDSQAPREQSTDRISSLEARIRSFMREVKTVLKQQRKLISQQVAGRAVGLEDKVDVLLQRSARSVRIEDEISNKLAWLMALEKARDDALRAWWRSLNPGAADVWPTFPMEILWRTASSSPTHNE
ncbi:hypothetical protein L6452_42570 [Arctium lappa]|uniref:Uncharacterized protein n=1 Tax=Arctium lappa TaxID=4217 RepID=A0ACB8XJR6_ARCLA|nr:hypothetical protein L6452_42570 [Arctium lappa]